MALAVSYAGNLISFGPHGPPKGTISGRQPQVYPSPLKLESGTFATFENVPDDAVLILYTSSGEEVWRKEKETGQDITWNGFNSSGNEVSIGLYLWYVELPDNTKISGKLVVTK